MLITAALPPPLTPPRKGEGNRESAAPLLHRLVEPLVVKRAEHRAELVAELPLRRCRSARVVGLLVLPGFDHGEVIGTARLLPESQSLRSRLIARQRLCPRTSQRALFTQVNPAGRNLIRELRFRSSIRTCWAQNPARA